MEMKGLRMRVGPAGGTNGAYNAIMENTCVCEGYTRAMQYLLKLKGINSHNVDCYAGKDTTHMADSKGENKYTTYKLPTDGYHSIICIDDYYSLYDDPCWNACRYQKGDKADQGGGGGVRFRLCIHGGSGGRGKEDSECAGGGRCHGYFSSHRLCGRAVARQSG